MKCSGKAKQAVIVCRMLRLPCGCCAAIALMQTKLDKPDFVKGRSVGELGAGGQQQWLHDQSIDRCGANQPSPEAQHRTRLI
jgi:hypothetical protein